MRIPTATPPTISHTNWPKPSDTEGTDPETTNPVVNCKASSPTASFTRLSPSIT